MMGKMQAPSVADQMRGRIAVVVMVALIVGGTGAWVAWDQLGASGIDPQQAKVLAMTYEAECVAASKDLRACKRHIGRRHRECMKQGGVVREPGKPVAYDQEAYSACLRAVREADLMQGPGR
jgi:hypothetical protein